MTDMKRNYIFSYLALVNKRYDRLSLVQSGPAWKCELSSRIFKDQYKTYLLYISYRNTIAKWRILCKTILIFQLCFIYTFVILLETHYLFHSRNTVSAIILNVFALQEYMQNTTVMTFAYLFYYIFKEIFTYLLYLAEVINSKTLYKYI